MIITVQNLEVAGESMLQEMDLLELQLLWSVTEVWGNFSLMVPKQLGRVLAVEPNL